MVQLIMSGPGDIQSGFWKLVDFGVAKTESLEAIVLEFRASGLFTRRCMFSNLRGPAEIILYTKDESDMGLSKVLFKSVREARLFPCQNFVPQRKVHLAFRHLALH